MVEESTKTQDRARRQALYESGAPLSEAEDLCLLMSAVFQHSGLDFRDYAPSWLRRRVRHVVSVEGTGTIRRLCEKVVADSSSMERLLGAVTIHVSAMFRDPSFYAVFRQRAVPMFRTFPSLRFWVAGCATGEEVYSLAILLHEEGLYERCRIYATDLNETMLANAREGRFRLSAMDEFSHNYKLAAGSRLLSDYYREDRDSAVFEAFLREKLTFAVHNLVCDSSFNDFQGIFCRNVLIYFNRRLQCRVHKLLYESLDTFGYLGLGRSESIRFSPHENEYQAVAPPARIYRKIR